MSGRLLSEGTRRRDFETIARVTEERGMALATFGTTEAQGVGVDALAEDWEFALEVLAEMVLESTFPEDRLEWVKRQTLTELGSLLDQGELRTRRRFLHQLYHPHPYGRFPQGTPETVTALTRQDCGSFHRQVLGWGGCLSVAGAIDEDRVQQHLEGLFEGLAGAPDSWPEVMEATGDGADRQHESLPSGEQAHLFVGHRTVSRNHPDMPALEVLGVVLGSGAGLSGRLPERIREREGLAYHVEVATAAGAGIDAGRMAAYIGTTPAMVEKAEASVREELDRLLQEGITATELADAKAYLEGRDPFRRETGRQWADLLTEAVLYGIPVDRPEWVGEVLRDLDLKTVNEVARRHLRPGDLRVTVGWPEKA